MDKALIGKSSSDPRLHLSSCRRYSRSELQSSTKKSRAHAAKETFVAVAPEPRPPETPRNSSSMLEDWDRVSAADFIGRVTVELDSLADQATCYGWYPLQIMAALTAAHRLIYACYLRSVPHMAFEPFEDQDQAQGAQESTLHGGRFGPRGSEADKNLTPSMRLVLPQA